MCKMINNVDHHQQMWTVTAKFHFCIYHSLISKAPFLSDVGHGKFFPNSKMCCLELSAFNEFLLIIYDLRAYLITTQNLITK